MQITSGLISCDPEVDASLVEGNASVDWTQVTIGSLLIVNGVSYGITSVNSVDKTLRISPNWVGAAVSSVTYVIVRDFTVNMQLPLLNPGDLEAAAIFSRAMRLLDGLADLVGTDPSVIDYLVAQNAHGFFVGNIIRLNGTAYELATAASSAASLALGVVSSVPDANSFYIRSVGKVTGMTLNACGLTLVEGQTYYLRATPSTVSTPGGDVTVNICTGNVLDTGPLVVPVLQANTTTSAFILGMAQASTNVFGANKSGLVPDPGGSLTGRLLYDTGWGDPAGLTNNTILARHLDPTVPSDLDWANFSARASNTPIHAFIMDLQTRLKAAELAISSGQYSRTVFNRKTNSNGLWSWSVPAGVTWCKITLFPGETSLTQTWYARPTYNHVPAQDIYEPPFSRGISFRLNLEGVTNLSGEIRSFYTTLNYNGGTPAANVGSSARPNSLRYHYTTIYLDGGPNNTTSVPEQPYEMLITEFRPEVGPAIYYSGLQLLKLKLLPFYFPGSSVVPNGTPNDLAGYYGTYQNTPIFAGAVVIETGHTI